jgi:2-amino-4-hydroxy-6-hydroxymethyldihydropteridine diphosphokinase
LSAGTVAYLGLGANLGDPIQMLTEAVHVLGDTDGISATRCSSLYRTSPVGKTNQPDFVNIVVRIETTLSADDLMTVILDIEHTLGRVRTDRWGPRTIDIDLLIYGDSRIETERLTVPHPRMLGRRFVLVPLIEIAHDLQVPGTKKSLKEFLDLAEYQGNIEALDVVINI